MAAAADELFHFWLLFRDKRWLETLQKFARCVIFNQTADYTYITDI